MNIDPAHATAYIINPFSGRKVQFANLFICRFQIFLTHVIALDRLYYHRSQFVH